MTVKEVIDRIHKTRNEKILTNDFIVEKLNEVEWKIIREIIDLHEECEKIKFNGYSSENYNTELIASPPYDALYIRWIEYQTDLSGNESFNAQNSQSLFYKEFYDFARWYRRTHVPKQKAKIGMKGYYI